MKLHAQEELSRQVVLSFLNHSVTAVYRVLDVVKGETNWADGFLEIHFSDDSWLCLRGFSNGETLLAVTERWVDRLVGDLDAETQAWVNEYGKDELIDTSNLDHYRNIIGRNLSEVNFIIYYQALAGTQLVFEDVYLNFVYVADECRVMWGKTLDSSSFRIVSNDELLSS